MDAIELAKGIALRQAEQFGPYQRRTTYAFSDWLDQHCDELLAAATELLSLRERLVELQHARRKRPQQGHLSGVNDDYYMPGHKHETKESETHMTDPIIDVQTTLDDWLASNPEAQKYVRKIYYVPAGAQIPRDVTHMNRLTSIDYPDLELRLGVVATLETAALANLILGILERTADDPKA